jgi:hydroxymethylbilane synthase
MEVIIVTRESTLALAQTNMALQALQSSADHLLDTQLLPTKTLGDKYRSRWAQYAAANPGITKRKWIFELEEALVAGDANIAIHSGKDVPDTVADGTVLVPILKRANPFDLLIFCSEANKRTFEESGGDCSLAIGTSSKRRAAELWRLGQSLKIKELRGNITTRIKKLKEQSELDAIVLAACGLARIGLVPEHTIELNKYQMTPAMSQGVLVAQCREDDYASRELLGRLVDRTTALCWMVERACVEALGVGCDTAFGVFCESIDGRYEVLARGVSPDGRQLCEMVLREKCMSENQAKALGHRLADALRCKGVSEVMRGEPALPVADLG